MRMTIAELLPLSGQNLTNEWEAKGLLARLRVILRHFRQVTLRITRWPFSRLPAPGNPTTRRGISLDEALGIA